MAETRGKSEEELKKQLDEAMKKLRPQLLEAKSKGSVADRVGKLANRSDDETKVVAKEKAKPLGLSDLAKKGKELDKKAKEANIDITRPTAKKDDKSKENEQEKKKEKEKENTPEKQEAKMKEMFSKVSLPSGMEIHQEGPQWVLVSKDGKQRTDVTDVMNTIDKYNQNVDKTNAENSAQNAAQNSVDKAAEKPKDKDNTISTETKVSTVEQVLPNVKSMDGQAVFNPEDVHKVAETAISFSIEKANLEKLKDPKALEEMRKREQKNERVAEEMARNHQMEQARGGRN